MAVENLTPAEWSALVDAAVLQDVTWEQDGDAAERRQRPALHRAMVKVNQLAPAGHVPVGRVMARHTLSVRVEVEVDTDEHNPLELVTATLAQQARDAIAPDFAVVRVIHAATVVRRP